MTVKWGRRTQGLGAAMVMHGACVRRMRPNGSVSAQNISSTWVRGSTVDIDNRQATVLEQVNRPVINALEASTSIPWDKPRIGHEEVAIVRILEDEGTTEGRSRRVQKFPRYPRLAPRMFHGHLHPFLVEAI